MQCSVDGVCFELKYQCVFRIPVPTALYTFRRPGTELIHQRPPLPPAPAESPPLRSPLPPPRSQAVVGCPLPARGPRAHAHRRTPASSPTQDRAAAWHGGLAPRRRKHTGSDLVSASRLSGGSSQRQTVLQAALSLGQPRARPGRISRLGRASTSVLVVSTGPRTTKPRRARVSATLRRLGSARKPRRPCSLARTHENTTTWLGLGRVGEGLGLGTGLGLGLG